MNAPEPPSAETAAAPAVDVPVDTPAATDEIERPYPLARLFRYRFLPAFALVAIVSAVLAGWGGMHLVQTIYLQFAERRAVVIDRATAAAAPEAWRQLKAGVPPWDVYSSPEGTKLLTALDDEVKELNLVDLKIYGADGLVLYSTESDKIGQYDASKAYVEAATDGDPSAVLKEPPGGPALYELYVRLPTTTVGGPATVIELYEPVGQLNRLLLFAGVPALAVPVVLLGLLALGLASLVRRAQAHIDQRTARLAELKARLETFVSGTAAKAARASLDSGSAEVRSEKTVATLLYSDVRGFTAFSEDRDPAAVVAFLNDLMARQVEAVRAAGGDVDKMIGDALLARFDGEHKEARAIRAARAIQKDFAAVPPARGVGVGVYTGEVISGAVGPPDRRDFTVIGDSVNTAARLCAAAAAGEVVADTATLTTAGADAQGFAAEEDLTVKGRRHPIAVRRLGTLPTGDR